MSRKLSRRATAYHEAGHAVAAVRLGFDLDFVLIFDPPLQHSDRSEIYGCARIRARDLGGLPIGAGFANLGVVHAALQSLLAGPIAQKLAAPRSRQVSSSDHRDALTLGKVVCRSDRGVDVALRLARIEGEALLRRDWKLVSAVAERLLATDALSGADIRELVEAHDRDLSPRSDTNADAGAAPPKRRAVRRTDVAAAALLVVSKLVSESEDQRVSSDMARALDAVGQWRSLDGDALQTVWQRVRDKEIARLAWRPVAQPVTPPSGRGRGTRGAPHRVLPEAKNNTGRPSAKVP